MSLTLAKARKRDNRKILYTEGGWTIRKWNTFEGSFVLHDKCGVHVERNMLDDMPMCDNCNIPVPEKLVGLWRLDNFDRIARMKAEYGKE